jgi:pyoverdine/dityrosine biosynthesis protein Dit1
MNQTTAQIVEAFSAYRMAPTAIDEYQTKGRQILADRIDSFVTQGQPIKFAMLGFPFKSTNTRDKVFGPAPDLGEQLTVQNFVDFNKTISNIYTPGVKITVASDGYVFNDLLGVADSTVADYTAHSQDYSRAGVFQIIDLNDFYTGHDLTSKRTRLMEQFGYTWEKMEQQILFNPDVNFLYRGMLRFMEEELAWQDFPSKSQRGKAAKKLVREMMLRNEAYNMLVRQEMADYIRLSMHPSVNNGYKYSFKLIPGARANHSAWHCVIVMHNGEAITMHKSEAIAAGYDIVTKDGKPYNFEY